MSTETALQTSATSTGVSLQVSALREIPLALVDESPWNPRRYFSPKGMEELTASVRATGVRTPILVRPHADRYQIAAGARRSRAARAAELATIPAVVTEMTDAEFIELLSFENANREDPHGLDEAHGIRFYMDEMHASVEDVAAKMGVSVSQVYSRLKLLHLTEELQQAFWDNRITAGHAVLIARLEPALQRRALAEGCYNQWSTELRSVRELARWIENQHGADLEDAPFDTTLTAEAAEAFAQYVNPPGRKAGCVDCPQRVESLCLDRGCYEAKIEAVIRQSCAKGLVAISTESNTKELPAGVIGAREFEQIYDEALDGDSGEEETVAEKQSVEDYAPVPLLSAVCKFEEDAIIAHGPRRGETMRICRNSQCPVHGEDLNRKPGASRDYCAQQLKDAKARAEKERLQKATRRRALQLLLDLDWSNAIEDDFAWWMLLGELSGFKSVELLRQANDFFRFLPEPKAKQKPAKLGAEQMLALLKKTAADWEGQGRRARLILFFRLFGSVDRVPYGFDLLAEMARDNGIDLKAVEKAIKAEEAKPKVAVPPAATSKKKAPKAKEAVKEAPEEPVASVEPEPAPESITVTVTRKYHVPDESGTYSLADCRKISCPAPAIDAQIYLIQCADGWRYACAVNLPEAKMGGVPEQKDRAHPSVEAAYAAAAKVLLSWSKAQEAREGAKKKHKQLATRLREWLDLVIEEGGPK
jgi:ParB family chromosome partitioning protein